MKRVLLLSACVLLCLVQACGSGVKPSEGQQAATVQPTWTAGLPAAPVYPSRGSTGEPPVESPASSSQTPTAGGRSAGTRPCISPDAQVSFTSDKLPAQQDVLDFLNSGGDPEELSQALQEMGSVGRFALVSVGDMTGDGFEEVVVSLPPQGGDPLQPGGSLLIFACQEGSYAVLYREQAQAVETGPHIQFLQDLNGDGQADLVKSRTTCGAHTCFDDLGIVVWNVEVFENRLAGSSADLPNPQVDVQPLNDSGQYALEVTGTGVGSIGAGPARPVTRVWEFNSQSGYWEVTRETRSDPIFRIHMVYDADELATQGELARAEALYRRVIEAEDLQPWHDPLVERSNLSAYAGFRLVVLAHIEGEPARAESYLEELKTQFPPGSSQYVFVQMAEAFRQAYQPGDASAGCQAARAIAIQFSVPALFEYGYANPAYTPESLCPWE